jgi:hypothetical protein
MENGLSYFLIVKKGERGLILQVDPNGSVLLANKLRK